MRHKTAALVTALLTVIGMAIGIGFSATPALAQTASIICTPPNTSPSQCINNTDGDARNMNLLQYWQDTPGGLINNSWDAKVIGTVKDGEGGTLWPFSDGSGLNTRYNGNNVYQFNWYPNLNYCAGQYNFIIDSEEGPLQLYNCASSTYQDFVFSKYGYLVAVGASNELYQSGAGEDNPVWLNGEAGGTANGDLVWMGTITGLSWSITGVDFP